MTTIAYDGRYLSADRQRTGTYKFTASKLQTLADGTVIAGCGTVAHIQAFTRWYEAGADIDTYPEGKDFSALVATPDGKVTCYDDDCCIMDVTGQKVAIGSGGDFAMGAMHCGKIAERAVEVASELDRDTGFGVDTIDTTKIGNRRRR